MTKKFYALSLVLALTLGLGAAISGFAGRTAASAPGALSALPASDIVFTIDTQRLLSEALPSILADNPGVLAKLNARIETFNKETGVDLRTFDSVAVGLRFRSQSTKDFDAVVVSRGHFNASDVIEAGFAAAKNKNEFQRTEEQYEGKTIFVLRPVKNETGRAEGDARAKSSAPVAAQKPEAKAKLSAEAPAAAPATEQQYDVYVKTSAEQPMAIVALDATTIAVGDLKSVRAAIDASMGREHVDDELARLATQNPSALVGFSGRIPAAVKEKMLAGKGGPETKYIASIQEFYGSFSTTGTDTESLIAVRTENAGQAHDLGQALNTLKMLSGFGMSQSGKGESALIAEALKGLSITTQDNEVQIKLNLNQKAFAPFVHGF
ncbi:MAG TPA: hypothetical protein VGC89_22195 [Pyrinomonadaceae bacterium]